MSYCNNDSGPIWAQIREEAVVDRTMKEAKPKIGWMFIDFTYTVDSLEFTENIEKYNFTKGSDLVNHLIGSKQRIESDFQIVYANIIEPGGNTTGIEFV